LLAGSMAQGPVRVKLAPPRNVQFDGLAATYLFGVSVFDNAQVRHAYVKKPISLVYKK
jgi:hypothetical protein